MQCIQLVRNADNEHKRPGNSSTVIEHIDVIVFNAVQVLQSVTVSILSQTLTK